MSDLSDLEQNLGTSWRDLQKEWSEIRLGWCDRASEHFEREWWDELEAEIPGLLSSMEELDEVFRQTAQELE